MIQEKSMIVVEDKTIDGKYFTYTYTETDEPVTQLSAE